MGYLVTVSERSCYAWFNSTVPVTILPRAYPREFAHLFSLGGLFPTPRHAERDNSPPLGLPIDHKYVVLCTKHRLRYWFPYNSKTRRFDKNLNAFLEFLERRALHIWCNKNMNTKVEKENWRKTSNRTGIRLTSKEMVFATWFILNIAHTHKRPVNQNWWQHFQGVFLSLFHKNERWTEPSLI